MPDCWQMTGTWWEKKWLVHELPPAKKEQLVGSNGKEGNIVCRRSSFTESCTDFLAESVIGYLLQIILEGQMSYCFCYLLSSGLTAWFSWAFRGRRFCQENFKVAGDRGVSAWYLEVNIAVLLIHCVNHWMFDIKVMAPDSWRPVGYNIISLPKSRLRNIWEGICLSDSEQWTIKSCCCSCQFCFELFVRSWSSNSETYKLFVNLSINLFSWLVMHLGLYFLI